MFERFTESAQQAVVRSQSIAQQRNDRKIGPIHLLLGAREGDPAIESVLDHFGLVIEVLNDLLDANDENVGLEVLGIDRQLVEQTADRTFGDGALERAESSQRFRFRLRRRPHGFTHFTNGAKSCLEQALRVSLARGDSFICSAHVASGAVVTREGALSIFLATSGVDVPQLQKELGDCVATVDITP